MQNETTGGADTEAESSAVAAMRKVNGFSVVTETPAGVLVLVDPRGGVIAVDSHSHDMLGQHREDMRGLAAMLWAYDLAVRLGRLRPLPLTKVDL